MNKKIVAISILMLMMCAMAASVFAEDNDTEYQYEVTVYVKLENNSTRPKTYTVWAKNAREAEEVAAKYCADDVGREKIVSCGVPRATGKTR
ncbi:MAG: hypothetical protein LBU85_06010 [Treponema sp.]|jgi:hypothetical protein|nr:hypothetical protein [Treponema sp.]